MSERFDPPYPGYDVLEKWRTPSWNPVTRDAVMDRLKPLPDEPAFFDAKRFAILERLCDVVLPQPDRSRAIPVAQAIDADLAQGRSTGTRYHNLLPDDVLWPQFLDGLASLAQEQYGCGTDKLTGDEFGSLLRDIDRDAPVAAPFFGFPVAVAFRDVVLKAMVAAYYAHPDAWSEIGFGGPASPRGYARLGFDRDPWEAKRETQHP